MRVRVRAFVCVVCIRIRVCVRACTCMHNFNAEDETRVMANIREIVEGSKDNLSNKFKPDMDVI